MVISLYIHIPLCTKKCDYCHFYVVPNKELFKKQLLEGLALEWERIAPKIAGNEIVSIYFGGGTPSLLSPHEIEEILNKIPAKNAEVTLEANPETVTLETLRQFKDVGINRVSLGVQSLDDHELATLSRSHGAKQAIQATKIISEAGFKNISIDLMFDTPGQTLESWKNTLDKACQLPITHLSLYNLTFEPHTVFYKKQQELKQKLPSEDTSKAMYEMACTKLQAHGLKQYEISAFAKTGYRSIHNTGYWTARPFFGLGPSAFSYFDGARFQNIAHLSRYLERLKSKKSPVDFYEKLDANAAKKELLAIQLRLLDGATFEAPPDEIKKLLLEGFLREKEGKIKLTKKGILFYDFVASEIIEEPCE